MNVVEFLFGCLFSGMALWGIFSGEIYVLADKASAGGGGWASFSDHPVIFLLALCIYLVCGVSFLRGGLKRDE